MNEAVENVVCNTRPTAADQSVRERNLVAIVRELARELHPQHAGPDIEPLLPALCERDSAGVARFRRGRATARRAANAHRLADRS